MFVCIILLFAFFMLLCVPRPTLYIFHTPVARYSLYICAESAVKHQQNKQTSCTRGDTICLRPLQVDNSFAFIRQVAPVPACLAI